MKKIYQKFDLPKPLIRPEKVEIVESFIDMNGSGLELGPGISPMFRKSKGHHVKYLESLSTDDIIERTKRHGKDVSRVEEIDYVLNRNQELKENVQRNTFDWVISSHVVEHIPDFVGHLRDVASVLNEDGIYALLVPDRNYCFDCLKPRSTLGHVIQAYIGDAHTKKISHLVDEWRYGAIPKGHKMGGWKPENALQDLRSKHGPWIGRVSALLANPESALEDWFGHQWHFDPVTFSDIVGDLIDLSLIEFEVIHLQPTYNMDFIAILKRTASPNADASRAFGNEVAQTYMIPDYSSF